MLRLSLRGVRNDSPSRVASGYTDEPRNCGATQQLRPNSSISIPATLVRDKVQTYEDWEPVEPAFAIAEGFSLPGCGPFVVFCLVGLELMRQGFNAEVRASHMGCFWDRCGEQPHRSSWSHQPRTPLQ